MAGWHVMALSLFIVALIGVMSVSYSYEFSAIAQENLIGYFDAGGRLISDSDGTVYALEAGRVLGDNVEWRNASGVFELHDEVDFERVYSEGDGEYVGSAGDSSGYFRSASVPSGSVFAILGLNLLLVAMNVGLIAVICVAFLLGLKVLGSGFEDHVGKTVLNVMFYGGLWFAVSTLGFIALCSIPFVGSVVYLVLTFGYFMGVWGIINGV